MKQTKEQIDEIVTQLEKSEHLFLLISDGNNHETFLAGDVASTIYTILKKYENIFEIVRDIITHVLIEKMNDARFNNDELLN